MADGATQPAQVLCRKVSNPYVGLGVIIGYADGSNAKEVLTTDFFLTGAGTNLDGWDDTGPEDLEPGGNKLHWIYTKVITPLATYPDPTGLTVNVISGDYPYLGSRKTYAGSVAYALTQNPNPGEHYLAGLYLDAANTLQVVYGTSVSTATTAPEPSWPAGAFRLSAVLIDDVQTSIDFDTDIFDRRLAWSDEQAGGSGWPFSQEITIDPTDPDADESTIAAGLAAASANYLLTAGVATYAETIALNKNVTLLGRSGSRTFITGPFSITSLGGELENVWLLVSSGTQAFTASVTTTITNCRIDHTPGNDAKAIVCSTATMTLRGVIATSTGGTTSRVLEVSGGTCLVDDDCDFQALGAGTKADVYISGGTVRLNGPILRNGTITNTGGTVTGWYRDGNGGVHLVGSGGTSQYVKQATADGALTVGTIAAADLPAASESAAGAAEIATQAETDAGTDDLRIVTPLKLASAATVSHPLSVLNTSGATAAANDVGYLVYAAASGVEYKTTTTVLDDKATQACVVVVGAANNATIKVSTRGRFTVPYTGSAPAAGDYMVFSSTATKLTLSTIMRPEVCAIAQAAGAGGVVDVLLLTQTVPIPVTPANEFFRADSVSASTFTATIATLPGGAPTTLTYTIVTGQEDTLVPFASGMLTYLRLYNTTRGDSALISACNTGTNTITLTANVPAGWTVGDAITPNSQTTSAIVVTFYDYQIQDTSVVPALARGLGLFMSYKTSATGKYFLVHPHATAVAAKLSGFANGTTIADANVLFSTVPLLDRQIAVGWEANGTGTAFPLLRVKEILLAAP